MLTVSNSRGFAVFRVVSIIILAVALTACARSAIRLEEKPAPDSVIGVMVALDENPRHVHVATLVFGNFQRKDVSNWGLNAELYERMRKRIAAQFGLQAKRVAATPEFAKTFGASILAADQSNLSGKRGQELDQIARPRQGRFSARFQTSQISNVPELHRLQ